MKIGILTLPLHTNYGGILQAWALQTVLQRLGYDVEVFGRKKKFNSRTLILPAVWCIRLMRKSFFHSPVPVFAEQQKTRIRRRLVGKIDTFIKERINHKFIQSPWHIPSNKYDAIIVGSDQIWRKRCISDVWGISDYLSVFLPGSKYDNMLKISYAASFGIENWEYTQNESAEISSCLSGFSAVSVRELSAVDLLKKYAGIEARFVLDPTMLLSSKEYIDELNLKVADKGDVLVSYILDANSGTSMFIDKVKEAKQIPHLELNAVRDDGSMPSIEEWVSGIASANLIVTDSFHGCVFSIIFHKPLIFIKNEHRGNARFDSLINAFGLEGNCIGVSDDVDFTQSFNLPDDISGRLAVLKQESLNFITKALCSDVR